MVENSGKTLIFTDTDDGGIIHIANIKGGVGKSTVATNLVAALSQKGSSLLIDLDVQGSATVALGHTVVCGKGSSWELLSKRFSPPEQEHSLQNIFTRLIKSIKRIEKRLFGWIIGNGNLTSLVIPIQPGLDLIPAGTSLFKTPSRYQLSNLRFNLAVCREYYKYIVIDTPSTWNDLSRELYLVSDLNLIPVTLNALSTRSLREYLGNVRSLARNHSNIRLRILKNEVFGTQDSKIIGKTRTMNENRRFLENLCEQISFIGSKGVSMLPQSIIFDLEIPESATVRNAQDEGVPVYRYQQYGKITKAFDELSRRVQFVLNTPLDRPVRNTALETVDAGVIALAAMVIFCILGGIGNRVGFARPPRPIAPQQVMVPSGGVFSHTFGKDESIHRLAKYAICRFRAVVPSWAEINEYIDEVITIHNITRGENEPRISQYSIPAGTRLTFYPPTAISNDQEKRLVPVYNYFIRMVDDPYAYVTGDWCERGTGGGQPHYGIDIAANLGSRIFAPVNGRVIHSTNSTAGNVLGIVNEETVIFFCHLDKRFLREGSIAAKGQAIGTVGLSGRTSGPHVHIGYGIKSQNRGDMKFGSAFYRITDPKLFFYREMYFENVAKK